MWNRGGIRSSALERAKAQLSMRGFTNSADQRRDVINARYGKPHPLRQMPLNSLSDLSSEAETEKLDFAANPGKKVPQFTEPVEQFDIGGGRRFLKNRQSSPTNTSDVRLISPRGSQSLALSKIAVFEERFRNRTNKLGIEPRASIKSGLSVQSRSELNGDRNRFLKKKASAPEDQTLSEKPDIYKAPALSGSHMQINVSMDSDEEDMRILLGDSFETSDGAKGRRQTETSLQQPVKTYRKSRKTVVLPAPEHKEKQPFHSALTTQHHKSFSPTSPSFPNVSSPRSPRSQRDVTSSLSSAPDHSVIRSIAELSPIASDHDDTQSERSMLSEDFKFNVMSVEDLVPLDVAGSKEKRSTSSQEHASSRETLHKPEVESVEYESDFQTYASDGSDQSVDEISEHLSGGNEHFIVASESHPQSLSAMSNSHDDYPLSEKQSKFASRRHRRTKSSVNHSRGSGGDEHSIVTSEPHPQSLSVKSDHHDDYTLSEKQSNFASRHHNRSTSSVSHSRGSGALSYSRNATHTRTNPPSRLHKEDVIDQMQAEGLTNMWPFDPAVLSPAVEMYMDPTPVVSHMISTEALEALVSYNPAVFALNDMMRQQLTLIRYFMQSSRQTYQDLLETFGSTNYRYSTVEDTKEFISCNRPHNLTMEDALVEVQQKMKNYHCV